MSYSIPVDVSMRGFDFYWKSWKVVEDWKRRHHFASLASYAAQTNLTVPMNFQENVPTLPHQLLQSPACKRAEVDNNYLFPGCINNEEDSSLECAMYDEKFSDDSSDNDDNDDDDDDDDDDDELELEFVVNKEMIKFFEQSMRHKMELQKQREQLKNGVSGTEEKSITNIKKDKNSKSKKKDLFSSQSSSKSLSMEIPNVSFNCRKRSQEMNTLFGEDAPKICGMETALQLSFNRLCDYNKPVYWPCIPFKP